MTEHDISHLMSLKDNHYGRVRNTVGNYVYDCNPPAFNGTLIMKKGSWRVNKRLWKPQVVVSKGGRFPDWVPKYVREHVRVAEKKVMWK